MEVGGPSDYVVEQETNSTRSFPSSNEVSLLGIVKLLANSQTLGAKLVCCAVELIKIKPQNVKRNWAV